MKSIKRINKALDNSKFLRMMKENIFSKHISLSIIMTYNLIVILVAVLFYRLVPFLLNYPHNFSQIMAELGASYTFQYITIIILAVTIGTLFLVIVLRKINNWEKTINLDPKNNNCRIEIHSIREKCINLPYSIYFVHILIPIISMALIPTYYILLNKTSLFLVFKLVIIFLSFFSLVAVFSLIFSKRLFTQILVRTYQGQETEGFRIGLRKKIFLQVLPMFIVAILFTSVIGYSRLVDEKGDLLFKLYKQQLIEKFMNYNPNQIKDIDTIKNILKKIEFEKGTKGEYFIVSPNSKIITLNQTDLGRVFTLSLTKLLKNDSGHVYGETGETQGVFIKINGLNGIWIVGIKYEIISSGIVIFFIISFIILLVINIFVLYYFSSSIIEDITLIASNLSEIAEGAEVDLDKKIPVTSNDEIGDLVVAFNKIQDREKQHIRDIKENQRVLLERERLAALGQMIGGIAHNLRSPIMSIAGGVEALKDLVKEYDESVDNVSVTKEDHHEIAKEMMEWLESMRPYCSFMSDLISAVREQAVQLNASTHNDFTLEELVKRIEILLKFELKRNNCTIETDVQVDLNTTINGEVNNLVQVCNNLIINAIQAYDGQGGKIEFKVSRRDTEIVFTIKDYGKGMPPEIKTRLLKEMITTKGKRGTGLGLFMSSLTIKGRFGGDLWFESEEGKGSTFYFSIPCSWS